jgi:membrane protein
MGSTDRNVGRADIAHARTIGAIKNGCGLLKRTAVCFMADEALSRGAAMAFYAVTALAPVSLIMVAIAGAVFGADAARDALTGKFQSLMGKASAELLQGLIKSASHKSSGITATVVGLVTLLRVCCYR